MNNTKQIHMTLGQQIAFEDQLESIQGQPESVTAFAVELARHEAVQILSARIGACKSELRRLGYVAASELKPPPPMAPREFRDRLLNPADASRSYDISKQQATEDLDGYPGPPPMPATPLPPMAQGLPIKPREFRDRTFEAERAEADREIAQQVVRNIPNERGDLLTPRAIDGDLPKPTGVRAPYSTDVPR